MLSLPRTLVAAALAVGARLAFAFSDSCATPRGVGATVRTTSGHVIGHAAPNATQVSEYLGIPFAQPPTGALRFAPPATFYSSRTINASHFGADCPSTPPSVPAGLSLQLSSLLRTLGQFDDPLDEDCLFLNVWSKPQVGSSSKPVLVWIYGGGFQYGGTNVATYSGQYFADTEDVVVVSINYRTNIFGFPGAPGVTQNAGLLDQRMAVEWIRTNIAGFGGDPTRITLFGQSAGGASVDLYSYAWLDDPIIAGTIMQSGTAVSFGNHRASSVETAWDRVASSVGCGNASTTSAEAVLECMRQPNLTWQTIERAASTAVGLASLQGSFGPTIDNKTVFANYTERALAGQYIKKPTLTGNCNYEAGLFILIAAATGTTLSQDQWKAFDQSIFTCPASTAARYRAEQGVPTWRYYYSGMFEDILLPTVNLSQAYHTAEVPVLFGTSQETSRTDSTWQERSLGDYLRGAWAAFAAYPEHGLSALYGWPEYDANKRTVILLGQDNQTVAQYGLAQDIDVNCTYPYPGYVNL